MLISRFLYDIRSRKFASWAALSQLFVKRDSNRSMMRVNCALLDIHPHVRCSGRRKDLELIGSKDEVTLSRKLPIFYFVCTRDGRGRSEIGKHCHLERQPRKLVFLRSSFPAEAPSLSHIYWFSLRKNEWVLTRKWKWDDVTFYACV